MLLLLLVLSLKVYSGLL